MSEYHLAQINIGTIKAPMESPELADFAANLDRINALAESLPGFIWRLKGEGNSATDLKAFDDPLMLVNMSLWSSPEELAAFVYRTGHSDIMRRRAEWFRKMELYMALWWVPAGHRPTPEEGIARLETLRRLGPTVAAFTFREPFPAPDVSQAQPTRDGVPLISPQDRRGAVTLEGVNALRDGGA